MIYHASWTLAWSQRSIGLSPVATSFSSNPSFVFRDSRHLAGFRAAAQRGFVISCCCAVLGSSALHSLHSVVLGYWCIKVTSSSNIFRNSGRVSPQAIEQRGCLDVEEEWCVWLDGMGLFKKVHKLSLIDITLNNTVTLGAVQRTLSNLSNGPRYREGWETCWRKKKTVMLGVFMSVRLTDSFPIILCCEGKVSRVVGAINSTHQQLFKSPFRITVSFDLPI